MNCGVFPMCQTQQFDVVGNPLASRVEAIPLTQQYEERESQSQGLVGLFKDILSGDQGSCSFCDQESSVICFSLM